MALQDVCGFQDTSMRLRFNPPASLSRAMEHTSPCLDVIDKQNFGHESLRSFERDGATPLSFLIPPPTPRNLGHFNRGPSSLFSPASPSSSSATSVQRPFPLSHGTTTLAFVFQGGVIAAADTRASAGGLVACPSVHKITPVHSHLVVTSSGGGADCALWERVLTREIRLYQLRNRRRPSTAGAAKLLAHMLHPFKGTDVCVAVTLCGWDEEAEGCAGSDSTGVGSGVSGGGSGGSVATVPLKGTLPERGGPKVVYVCSDGARLQGELISVGSGSPYAYGVLDGGLRWALSEEEAVALAREAVFRATRRDAYSGNSVDLFHVTARGWSRRKREDLKEEYYREEERMMKRVKERKDEAGMEEGD